MKLVKLAPALVATLVLAACSNQPETTQVAKEAPVQVKESTSKTIAYRCLSGKKVTANYVFQGDEAQAVDLELKEGKKVQKIPTLARNTENKDFASFISEQYIWNVDSEFNLANATKETTGMLTQKGKDSDDILAKLCDVDSKLTKKLNK